MKDPEELVRKVKEFISTNRTEKAIELLEEAQFPLLETPLILIKADFSKITEQQHIGIIDNDDANLEIRKINHKLIGLCNSLGREKKNEPSLTQGHKNLQRNRYLIPSLMVIIPVATALILLGFGFFENPIKPTEILSVPIVTEPKSSDFKFGTPVKISYEVPDYNGTLLISFIQKGDQSDRTIKRGNLPPSGSFSWTPPESLAGQSGYIEIKMEDGTIGKSAEIKLLEPVEEEKFIDLRIEYLKGKALWSKAPDSISDAKNFRYAFTLDYESRFESNSSIDGSIAYLLTLHIKSKKTDTWELVTNSNGILQKGESRIEQDEQELYVWKYGGRPLVHEDYVFKLCIENIKDGNESNNCVIDTFRTNAVTY